MKSLWLLLGNQHSCSLCIRFNRVTDQVRHEITKPRVANAMSSGYLVGGLEHFFSHMLGIVTPTDYFFQRGWNHQPGYNPSKLEHSTIIQLDIYDQDSLIHLSRGVKPLGTWYEHKYIYIHICICIYICRCVLDILRLVHMVCISMCFQ